MICAKLGFEAICSSTEGRHHETRVVDQEIKALVGSAKALSEDFNRLQTSQVERLKFNFGLRIALCNIRTRSLAFFLIAAGEDNLRAFLRENADSFKSYSTVRPGDNCDASGLIWNILFTSRHACSSFSFEVSLDFLELHSDRLS